MPKKNIDVNPEKFKYGQLSLIDDIPAGDPKIASAICAYANQTNESRQSRHWIRSVQWIENILFSMGRQYVDDILVSRLARDSTSGDQGVIGSSQARSIPRPVNDFLGRYIETNIALLTENKPRPRITPKSGRSEDEDSAQLSEMTMEFLWEALDMPELHREIARIILHTGVCWMEIAHDPTEPRRIAVPETIREEKSFITGPGGGEVAVPIPRDIVAREEKTGLPRYKQKVEYGEITARVISPFEMHLPISHWWNGDGFDWIMREYYAPIQSIIDRYSSDKRSMGLTKAKGWYLENLEEISGENVKNLPLWWWERLADLVEGPGPSIYVGTPEQWEGYTTVKIFDRKPSPKWPNGRTVIVAGGQVIYDSPKNIGARAYDPRWPDRWHPYTRFRWEGQAGSVYGRSLVSKLLPKLKRINAIDTTLIMWRRTVPIATWIAPKGANPVENLWSGMPGTVYEYDPRLTAGKAPEPVFPPDYPKTALEERAMQISEMESIAGTEEILRGQRPAGVTSATMLNVLRNQALASRSAVLQSWDESLQEEGSALLQEVIKNIREDSRYAEGLKIIARERQSSLTIEQFSGTNLSDNVNIHIDTASEALSSKEAREQKMIEVMQYLPNIMSVPPHLRAAFWDELGLTNKIEPQGPDVQRAKRMLAWIRQGDFARVIPYVEDDPYVFYDILTSELKTDAFFNLGIQQQQLMLGLIDLYKKKIEEIEAQQMRMQQMLMQQQGGGGRMQ